MPPFGPISRSNLVRALRKAGFESPFAGGEACLHSTRESHTFDSQPTSRRHRTRSAEPDIAAGRGIPGGMGSVVITIHSAETCVVSKPYCRPPAAVAAALTRSIRSIRFRVPWFSTRPAVAIRQFEEYGVSSTG
jgi:hypothetical protein